MAFNYSKLCGRIVEKFNTQSAFAQQMGMSERSMSLKINSKIQWSQDQIIRACELLDIPFDQIPSYFFVVEVQK